MAIHIIIIEQAPKGYICIEEILECEIFRHIVHLCQIILALFVEAARVELGLIFIEDVNLEALPE